MKNSMIPAILLALLPIGASAHDYKINGLLVEHPVATATPASAPVGAGYMTISNTGDTADTLIAIRADFPQVMIHKSVIEDDIARMNHVPQLVIPAGETVTFAPGGYHVMFMGLNGDPFEVGEKVSATLVFEKAGELDVIFNVEALSHNH